MTARARVMASTEFVVKAAKAAAVVVVIVTTQAVQQAWDLALSRRGTCASSSAGTSGGCRAHAVRLLCMTRVYAVCGCVFCTIAIVDRCVIFISPSASTANGAWGLSCRSLCKRFYRWQLGSVAVALEMELAPVPAPAPAPPAVAVVPAPSLVLAAAAVALEVAAARAVIVVVPPAPAVVADTTR